MRYSFCSSIYSSVVSFFSSCSLSMTSFWSAYLTLLHFQKLFTFFVGHLHTFVCFCMFVLSLSFFPFLFVLSCFLGHSPFLFSFLNICFSCVSFFVVLFECISFFFLWDSLWFYYPFSALKKTFYELSFLFNNHVFYLIVSVFAVFLFFKKNPFSFFLFYHFMRKNFVIENLLTHFETSDFELFTFTSTNSTSSLLECRLCHFIPSFCSSSFHLFSLVSPCILVSFTFSLFLIFLGLGSSL